MRVVPAVLAVGLLAIAAYALHLRAENAKLREVLEQCRVLTATPRPPARMTPRD